MKKKATKEIKTKTLFAKMQDRTHKKITIPADCKVTFGPLCPGSKGGNNGSGSTALRIYNGATQVACFVQVESFYEVGTVVSIGKVTKRADKIQAYQEDGVTKQRSVAVEVSEWKDELSEEESSDSTGVFKALKAEHDDGQF